MGQTEPRQVEYLRVQSNCVGCQHRPDIAALVVDADPEELVDKLRIDFEPDNAYDSGAIKVTFDGELLGYIPKDKQIPMRRFLRRLEDIYVTYECNCDGALRWIWNVNYIKWTGEKTFDWFDFELRIYGSEC